MNRSAIRVSTFLFAGIAAYSQSEFAVASVRPNHAGNAGGEGSEREKTTLSPSSLIMWNVTLRYCIRWAYDLRDYQIVAPGWLASQRYDISAKASGDVPVHEMRLMLQRLLVDRFQLAVRSDAKELPVYIMSLKTRNKLKPAAGGPSSMLPVGGAIEFRNYSMAELVEHLGSRPFKLDRLVLDKTGLEGVYDFRVEFAADPSGLKHTLEGMEQGQQGAPSMVPILQEQLGLTFKPEKAPVDSLIIEHAEKVPKEN